MPLTVMTSTVPMTNQLDIPTSGLVKQQVNPVWSLTTSFQPWKPVGYFQKTNSAGPVLSGNNEQLYLNPPTDGIELYKVLKHWFSEYNNERRHMALNGVVPKTVFYA